MFTEYYKAVQNHSEKKWNYTTDTVKVWFDDKKGKPVLNIKGTGSTGMWEEWDEEMDATASYDSLWYNETEHTIKGYFYENNDFYRLLGKGPTKTLQTYWLNENDKIKEVLIYWIPEENTTTSEHIKPVVEWAKENDSTEIRKLYSNEKLIPTRHNAKRWKALLKKYNEQKK